MPGGRERMELEIAADSSAVKRAGRDIIDFSRTLRTVVDVQARLTRGLLGVEKGSEAYKRLGRELRQVAAEARLVETALKGLERVTAESDRAAERRQQRRRGFFAGVGQGLGIAQYIPADAGMVPRMAGAMVGGAMRAGAAPFMYPGMQGLQTLLGAVPLVGPAAAGALGAGAEMYGQAVAYQQQLAQNLYLFGQRDPFEQGRRLAGVARDPRLGQLRAADAAVRQEEQRRDATRQTQQLSWEKEPPLIQRGGMIDWIARQVAETMLPPEVTGAPDRARRTAAARRNKIINAARAARSNAFAEAMGPANVLGVGFGANLGFAPSEVQQQLGAFMGARGGALTVEAGREFATSLAAQRALAIQAPLAGAFARMGQPGGGGLEQGPGGGLANVLQDAVTLGLSGSRVSEYLQELVSLGQAAESRGMKIDPLSVGGGAAFLRVRGIEGPQLARITGGFARAAMGLSERGVQGSQDMLMLRAFGWDPRKGPESYWTAQKAMQQDPMSGFADYIGMVRRAAWGPQDMKEGLVSRALGRQGVAVSFEQAGQLLAESDPAKLTTLLKRMMKPGAEEGLGAAAVAAVGRVAPQLPTEARLSAQRITVGQKFAGVMKATQQVTINTTEALSGLNDVLETIATTAGFVMPWVLRKTASGVAVLVGTGNQ